MVTIKKTVICIFLCCCCAFGGWLLTGCSDPAAAAGSVESTPEETDGKVLYGIVSRVNGNEIEVEYLTVTGTVRSFGGSGGGMPGGMSGQRPEGIVRGDGASGSMMMRNNGDGAPAMSGQGQSDLSGETRTFSRPEGALDGGTMPSGQLPDMSEADGEGLPPMPQDTEGEDEKITVTNITGSSSAYTRTGETATLLIPVGTPILAGAGDNQKVRTFNSLQSNYIIAITMKENADGTEYAASIQVLQTS